MRGLLLALFLILAGCSAPTNKILPPVESANKVFDQTFSLSLLEAGVSPSHTSMGRNCISFANTVRIQDGSARVDWSPATPASAQLEFWFSEFNSANARDIVRLPPHAPPIVAAFQNVSGQFEKAEFIIQVQVPAGGAVNQAATMRLTVNYTSDTEFKPQVSSCASG